MIPSALRARLVVAALLLAAFVSGVGVGRGTSAPGAEVALIGEAHEYLATLALRGPPGRRLSHEAIEGMLSALEDSYAEFLPRGGGGPDPGSPERILGIDDSALSEAAGLRGRILEPGVGHLGLELFSPGSGALVRAEVERMRLEGVRGVILDLRGNRGGLVEEALRVAGVFMGDDTVFLYSTAAGGEGERRGIGVATRDVVLVVCTDERTGSAAELVAGAVQDAGRGLVVGRRTAGKGSVQRVIELSDGSTIKFTAAVFRTPTGRGIDGVGLRPDVTVPRGPGDPVLERARSLARGG